MKKINTLDFSVAGTKKKKKHTGILPVILGIIVLGIVSTVFILSKNNFDIKKTLGLRDNEPSVSEITTLPEETQTAAEIDFTGAVNFLSVCYDDNRSVSFAFLVSVFPEESRIRIKPIDPLMNVTVFTGETTFTDAFSSVDIDHLLAGLENKNIPVNRYFVFSESDFVSIIQTLGTISMELDTDFVYYSNSIRYVCPAGLYEFTSDSLLAYMKHHGEGDTALDFSSNAAKIIIETFFNETNVSEGEALFTKLINFVTTDITAFDYLSAQPVINSLCSNGFTVTINS